MEDEKEIYSEKKSEPSTTVYEHPHSKRIQVFMILAFLGSCFLFLFVLESKLTERHKELSFDYREYYLRPFHYKLDPFTYVELKNGIPLEEPEPPNPHFIFSFEEMLYNRFVDYYFWTKGPTEEADITMLDDRVSTTIEAASAHLRNRLYYRLEKEEDLLNPILLTDPKLPEKPSDDPSKNTQPDKLVWNTIPYCTDPLLEEALHELGNIHGFMFIRGNHKNYRFVDEKGSQVIAKAVSTIPIKTAYLYDHNYINFTRHGFKNPVYVSIVCEPIQRKLRHFYTERHNYRNWEEDFPISKTKWWRQSLKECMDGKDNRECQYEGVKDIKNASMLDVGRTWLPRRVEWTVPQFCEFDHCKDLGIPADLDHAKNIVNKDFSVIGTLEKLDETLDVLEAKIPHFFKGIKEIYRAKVEEAKLNPKEDENKPVIPSVGNDQLEEMKKKYAPELNFYNFVNDRLKEDVTRYTKNQ